MTTTLPPDVAPGDQADDWTGLLLIATAGSLLSIIATGFVVGVRNDVYYLPIVHAIYDEPQFARDAFIQSLRHFSSGLWMILSGSAGHVDSYWLLLCLDYLSRFLTFAGFLACATLFGVRTRQEAALFTALLCTTSLLRGQSLAGDGGLFINYFTHSEIANGLTLLMLFFLVRGRIATAIFINGLVFFINAFIAVWDGAMIAAVIIVMALAGRISWRTVALNGTFGLALAALPAAPVLYNIILNADLATALDFDYVTYLDEFWPYHFLSSDIAPREMLALATLVTLGILAFAALGRPSRPFITAMAAFIGVYIMGMIAPHFTHSALVLNLHLLRVSTMLQLMAVLGSLVLATRWWFAEATFFQRLLAPILVLLLCTPIKMTSVQPICNATAAMLVIAASFYPSVAARLPRWMMDQRVRFNAVALALVAVSFVGLATKNFLSNAYAESWLSEWTAIGRWASSTTDANDIFMIPIWNFRGSPVQTAAGSDLDDAILNSGMFQSVAQRSVWIDYRAGAAVMWSPSYYGEWHQRVTEVNALSSVADKVAYAQAHGIRYVVDLCRRDPTQVPAFSTRRLCVYAAEPPLHRTPLDNAQIMRP